MGLLDEYGSFMSKEQRDYMYALPQDVAEASALGPVKQADTGVPWWQSLAIYGVTKVIDNQFQAPSVSGNVQPGSFAGQDGQTYASTAVPTQPRAGVVEQAGVSGAMGGNKGLMLLAGLGAIGFILSQD